MTTPDPSSAAALTALNGASAANNTAKANKNNAGAGTGTGDSATSAVAPQGGAWKSGDATQQAEAVAAATNQATNGMTQFNQNALGLPDASAYTPQNAAGNLKAVAGGYSLGQVANNGQVGNVNLGNAATVAPLTNLNGAQVGTGTQQQNAVAQQTAINNLNNIATGNGPNAATIAASQQAQQTSAAQMAAIASAGGNPALAQRNAAAAAANAQQQGAANAVLGSAQEQLGAQGTLQSALGNITSTGQAIPLAQAQLNANQQLANQNLGNANAQQDATAANATNLQQGSMNQQTNLANQQANISSTSLAAQQYNAMLGAQMQQTSYDTAQAENYQNAYQQAQEQLNSTAAGQGIASMNNSTQLTGATIGAVGAGLAGAASLIPNATAASDKRVKTNIKSGNRDLKMFFKKLSVL